jgi:3-oxoacyl-[acyl-carrier-protein] synthase II
MSRDVVPVITGLGLVTPLGSDADQTFSALLAGEYIRTHSLARLDAPAGDRLNRIAVHAARRALTQSRWTSGNDDTAIVVGTSKGPVDAWLATLTLAHQSQAIPTGGSEATLGLSHLARSLARDLNWTSAPCLTLSAACASGLHALIRACLMLQFGEARRVLVVAAESSLHPLFIASFNRLGVLPDEATGCRPFDMNRGGFLMSEAAAAVCLELPEQGSSPPLAAIDGFATGSDAYHLTGVDPTSKTLRRLIQQATRGRCPDLVHAHATGTPANDPVELAAIESAHPNADRAPILYSHKGALGHSLGAAGLVSIVLSCLIHRNGVVPPNVRTTQPIPMSRAVLSKEPLRHPIRHSIAVAAGFGGPAAVVALRSA